MVIGVPIVYEITLVFNKLFIENIDISWAAFVNEGSFLKKRERFIQLKKTIISIIVILAAGVMAVLCIVYFRGGRPDKDAPTLAEVTDTDGMDTSIAVQDQEPDEASKELAEYLSDHLDHEVDARYVVSTGRTIRNLPYAYTVDSWQVTKQNPGNYQLTEYPDAQYDENMNLMNDYSYVVVDITVENLRDTEVTQALWGFIRLRLKGAEESYTGGVIDMVDLAANVVKERNKDAFKETFIGKETRKERLIYIVQDDLLSFSDGFYLSINHTGMSDDDLNKLDTEVRRWIILN